MITAKFHGHVALSAKLTRMQMQAPGVLKEALLKAAQPIRDEAELLAPVSDKPGGHLAQGIKIRLMRSTAPGHERVRIGVKEALWYGTFPEYGTSKMAARPFMRPALDTQKNEALRILKAELKRSIP